jgi:N-acetylmuramoyl-L-alanine amidase
VEGPLRINVVYPAPTDLVEARDSTFIFGSLGTGGATLLVNGHPIEVWPNGAWLAWLPIPPDSVIALHLVARTRTDSAILDYPVRRIPRFRPPPVPVWIDSTSLAPSGRVWWPADEYLPVSVRAVEGADLRIRLPGGAWVPLTPERRPEEVPWGIRAFDRDTANLAAAQHADRYVGVLRGISLGPDPGPLVGSPPPAVSMGRCRMCPGGGMPAVVSQDSAAVYVEAILGPDTARVRWPLQIRLLDSLPAVVEFNDDPTGRGDTDSLTIGRAKPGGTYHWFMPTGTRAVATGRLGDDLRVRLSGRQDAWVPAADAQPLPAGTPAVRSVAGSVTVTSLEDRLVLRIPMSQRVPFRIEEGGDRLTLRLYGGLGDVNWMRYGPGDPFLKAMHWLQSATDETTLELDLARPFWGYRARWSRNDLLLEIRRPPRIDRDHPLAGRLIVLDPGHPPLGATGPTGFREAEANLAVALELRAMLEREGAHAVLTRASDAPLDLLRRTKLADSLGAEILVSIHNNALPDGVNPFTNNGSSVYYNRGQSLELARLIQASLVRRLGLRDLGIGWGDLALTRSSWMPAVLTEGLFIMLPEQEAALRQEAGRRLYARAVADGIEAFLVGVASGPAADVH